MAPVGLSAHQAMSLALPTEPHCLGSHYLDKYICPLDQPTGPASSSSFSSSSTPRDAIMVLITLSCPWDNSQAGITRTQTSVSIQSAAKYLSQAAAQLQRGVG